MLAVARADFQLGIDVLINTHWFEGVNRDAVVYV